MIIHQGNETIQHNLYKLDYRMVYYTVIPTHQLSLSLSHTHPSLHETCTKANSLQQDPSCFEDAQWSI